MKRDVLVTSLVKQKAAQKPAVDRSTDALRRVEHLESQMAKLSELVREHAEDVDRLVRIVAEDRDVIRRQLLRKHHEQVRVRSPRACGGCRSIGAHRGRRSRRHSTTVIAQAPGASAGPQTSS